MSNLQQSRSSNPPVPLAARVLLSTMAVAPNLCYQIHHLHLAPNLIVRPGIMRFSSAASASQPERLKEPDRGLAELAEEWRIGTRFTSSLTEMIAHPAYQQIIAIGLPALPFLLAELQRAPDHWFWALGKITGENPVPDSDSGDLEKMTAAWLDWGRRNEFI